MGDLNVKVGHYNSGHSSVMGKLNENGQLYADFCAENNLVIGETVFPHKEIHKTTWASSDQSTESQIDHIMFC